MMNKKISLSIFLILVLCKAYSQSLSFNLPFTDDNEMSEQFFLEPHYNKEYNLSYFSLGDFLKIDYTFDEQNRLLKKVMYTWDKYDYSWESASETFYTYTDNKLTEERTEQMVRQIFDRNVMSVKTVIQSKERIVDPNTNTDTTKLFINIPKTGSIASYSYTIVSVGYKNKMNLCDSVVAEYTYSNNMRHYAKSIYTYDKKDRIIRTEAQSSEDGIYWHTKFILDTHYDKNKITHTQIPVIPEMTDEEKEDMYRYGYELPDTLVYSFDFDNKKRITSQILQTGKSIVLNAQYTYDTQGRTIIKREQDIAKLMKFQGLGSFDLGNKFEYMRYTIEYDKEDCSRSVYEIKNENGEIMKLAETRNCYSPEGLLLLSEIIKYDEDDGVFDSQERIETKYDPDGFSGESIKYRMAKYYDSDKWVDEPDKKILFKNNANGKRLYEEEYNYYSDDNSWKPSERNICDYDVNGFLIHDERYSYDTYDKTWSGSYLSEYERDDKNRVLKEVKKEYRNNGWTNSSQDIYAYDTFGFRELIERYEWNDLRSEWKGIYRKTMKNNDQGDEIGSIDFRWNNERKEWVPNEKRELIESKNDLTKDEKEIFYEWVDNQWNPDYMKFSTQSYDTQTYSSSFGNSRWNNKTNDWEIHQLEKRLQTKDNVRVNEEYRWNSSLDLLEGSRHTSTRKLQSPSDNAGIKDTERSEIIPYERSSYNNDNEIVYSLWDYKTKAWRKAVCSTITTDKYGVETSIFESYDKHSDRRLPERKVIFEVVNDTVFYMEQSLWDMKSNKWILDRKIEYHNKEGYDNAYESISFRFDNQTGSWIPLFLWQDIRSNDETGDVYYRLNNSISDREEYCKYLNRGWFGSVVLIWNKSTGKWQESNDSALNKKINIELEEAFDVKRELDYESMVRANRQPKED